MYSINYLDKIWNDVENKIYAERLNYIKIYEIIEGYISEFNKESSKSSIMIGGTMGINLLLQKERTIDDFEYELYAEDAFLHANNLINKIDASFTNIKNKEDKEKNREKNIMFLKTTIPNIKYQIIIDLRVIITIFKLIENAYDLILPMKFKTFDKKHDILVVSPEILLIDIYRTLYSPNQASDWEKSLNNEVKLFKHLKNRLSFETEKKGSSENQITQNDRKLIELNILKQFITNNKNVILIGEHALKVIIGTEKTTPVIQIISQNIIEDDFIEIEKIIKSTYKRNLLVTKLTRELNIMKDFRIRRTTIKIGDKSSQKDIIYIYNSGQYDLLPFNTATDDETKKFIQIGNPFVLLRFLLIDFWMVRWIKYISGIDESFAEQRLSSILNKILILRTRMQFKSDANIDTKYFDSVSDLRIFQSLSSDYIGFYDDENISQKLLIKDLTKKFYDYYPSEYFKKNNSYRILY